MADLSPIWNSFNAGELSPLMDGRTDQPQYFSGCKVMQNFIPTVQGPAARRGGTRYICGLQPVSQTPTYANNDSSNFTGLTYPGLGRNVSELVYSYSVGARNVLLILQLNGK